jgi:hypothetical protein
MTNTPDFAKATRKRHIPPLKGYCASRHRGTKTEWLTVYRFARLFRVQKLPVSSKLVGLELAAYNTVQFYRVDRLRPEAPVRNRLIAAQIINEVLEEERFAELQKTNKAKPSSILSQRHQ